MSDHIEHVGCLTDPASEIPMALDMPDPGPSADGARAVCAVCYRHWVLREVAGFVVWVRAS